MTADGVDRALAAPQFDIVLRGYDRRQVDEHIARLQRVVARMRADLDAVRSQPFPAVSPAAGFPAPGGRPRPTPRPRPVPPGGEPPDMIGNFTDRMQSILQAAEEEAAEIRNKARAAARAEEERLRAQLADLVRQRDAVLAELTRLRGQLQSMLAAPTARMQAPTREGVPSPGPTAAKPEAEAAARQGDGPKPSATPRRPTPGPGTPKPGATPPTAEGASGHVPSRPGPERAPQQRAAGPGPAADVGRGGANRQPGAGTHGEANSMRPRGEPQPEPGDLFRPAADAHGEDGEPRTALVRTQTAQPEPAGDRTSVVPTMSPRGKSDRGERGGAAPAGSDQPAPTRVNVDATTKVAAVRPPSREAGAPASHEPQPAPGKDPHPGGRRVEPEKDQGRTQGGPTGANGARRAAAPSRQG